MTYHKKYPEKYNYFWGNYYIRKGYFWVCTGLGVAFILAALFASVLLAGCAGTGFDKKATLVPDEIWLSTDIDPQNSGKLTEITGGVKWKLK